MTTSCVTWFPSSYFAIIGQCKWIRDFTLHDIYNVTGTNKRPFRLQQIHLNLCIQTFYLALALYVHIYMQKLYMHFICAHLFLKEAIQSCSGKQAWRFLELKNNTCSYHVDWVTYQIFKKSGALQDRNFYKGVDGNKRCDLFQGGCSVYIKK